MGSTSSDTGRTRSRRAPGRDPPPPRRTARGACRPARLLQGLRPPDRGGGDIDASLVIVGDGPEGPRSAALAAGLPTSLLAGAVDEDELVALLAAGDCFVMCVDQPRRVVRDRGRRGAGHGAAGGGHRHRERHGRGRRGWVQRDGDSTRRRAALAQGSSTCSPTRNAARRWARPPASAPSPCTPWAIDARARDLYPRSGLGSGLSRGARVPIAAAVSAPHRPSSSPAASSGPGAIRPPSRVVAARAATATRAPGRRRNIEAASRAHSRSSGRSEAITGQPAAIASATGRPNPPSSMGRRAPSPRNTARRVARRSGSPPLQRRGRHAAPRTSVPAPQPGAPATTSQRHCAHWPARSSASPRGGSRAPCGPPSGRRRARGHRAAPGGNRASAP